jgi:acetylornithine deacetylase/succinyl-diaminopimelate desuccinylase-like protein
MYRKPLLREEIKPDVSGLSPLLKSLLSIDTRKESPDIHIAIDLLKNYCIKCGLLFSVTGPENGSVSLVVKIDGIHSRGDGLVLLSHLDTADWNIDNWNFNPLSAKQLEGKIYGRGAIDCKSLIVIWLNILKYMKIKGTERDIVLIISTDEETGGEEGLKWISENTNILKGFNSALNEGGGYILPAIGNRTAITCQYGEKGRIVFPVDHTEDIKEIFVREEGLKGFIAYLSAKRFYTSRNRIFKGCRMRPDLKNSFFNSLSIKNNRAELYYLPGIDPVKKIVNIQKKEIIPIMYGHKGQKKVNAASSSLRTELFRIIQNNAKKLSMDIVPLITRGYSDSRYLRSLGIDTYGFFPLGKREEIIRIHAADEHIHEESLHESFQILYNIVYQYALPN